MIVNSLLHFLLNVLGRNDKKTETTRWGRGGVVGAGGGGKRPVGRNDKGETSLGRQD